MKRGFSLMEALVMLGLAALLLTTVVQLVVQVMRSSQRMMSQGALDQTAAITSAWLVRDLQRTNASGLTWRPASPGKPLCVVIQPVREVIADGSIEYEPSEVILYAFWTDEHQLQRRLFTSTQPCPVAISIDAGKRFTPAEVDALLLAPSRVTTVSDVQDLAIKSDVDSPLISNPFRFRLRLERKSISGNSVEESLCIRSVSLRNTL